MGLLPLHHTLPVGKDRKEFTHTFFFVAVAAPHIVWFLNVKLENVLKRYVEVQSQATGLV